MGVVLLQILKSPRYARAHSSLSLSLSLSLSHSLFLYILHTYKKYVQRNLEITILLQQEECIVM